MWEFLGSLTKTPRAVSGAVAAGIFSLFGFAWLLGVFKPSQILAPAIFPYLALATVALFYCLILTAIHNKQKADHARAQRIFPFDKLDIQQQEKLKDIFKSGRREISVSKQQASESWLVGLVEREYLAPGGNPFLSEINYRITQRAWTEIENSLKR